MSTKETNPKDAVGIAKVPRSTTSARVFAEVGLAMLEGALKYGRHNFRVAGVRASVYYDAVDRHLAAWWEGQDTDPDSGLSHITKAIAGLMVLRDSMLQENWVDDRPPKTSDVNWVAGLNEKAAALLAKYPNPVPAHTEESINPTKPAEKRWFALATRIEAGDIVESINNEVWSGPMEVTWINDSYVECLHPTRGIGGFRAADLRVLKEHE